jgi:hypothetical protein
MLSFWQVRPGVEVLIGKPGEKRTERPQSCRIAGNHDLTRFIGDCDDTAQLGESHQFLLKGTPFILTICDGFCFPLNYISLSAFDCSPGR